MANLGDGVRDKITGFKGIVIAKAFYLIGCARVGVQSQELGKDGKPLEIQWVDEPQVEIVDKAVIKMEADDEPGGPAFSSPRKVETGELKNETQKQTGM